MKVLLAENGNSVEGKTVGIYSTETDSEQQVTYCLSSLVNSCYYSCLTPCLLCWGTFGYQYTFDE